MPDRSPSYGVRTLYARLSRLALDLDEALDPLESWYLSDGEADLLSVPILHLSIVLRRLEQLVFEVHALDQRPRRERLAA
jgi:hypothetical protein